MKILRVTSLVALAAALGAAFAYPATPVRPVTDSYFGTKVVDPYRWLEDPSDGAVRAWAAAQTEFARAYIGARPNYAWFHERVAALSRTSTRRFGLQVAGGRLFYLRQTPPQAQAELIVRDGLPGDEHVLYDPQAAANGGQVAAIESVFPSPDGSMVAFTTQLGGSEEETLHVMDAVSEKMLPDTLAHVGGGTSPTAVGWDGDGKGFVRTRWPQNADGSYAKSSIALYHHALGADPASDTYVFGRGLSPRAEYQLVDSRDGRAQAIFVTAGDGVHASVYLRRNGGTFRQVAAPSDGIGASNGAGGVFVDDALYVVAKGRDPRGEVVAIGADQTFATARRVVAPSNLVIDGITPAPNGFLTNDVDGGDGAVRAFSPTGRLRGRLAVPAVASITEFSGDGLSGPAVIGYQSYTSSSRWLYYNPQNNSLEPTRTVNTAPGDTSRVAVERVFVPSLDGKVRIPLEIVHLRGIARDGTAPTILYAYGAYGLVTQPRFVGTTLAWLERGGVFAQAMIRGGGEYGDSWHLAARLATKTVSSDDLAACARWLESHGYGNARHLGINGGSAGGFLMGLALTRNPELYRAVVAQVGIYDLLRVELTPNGAFNTPEFGTVTNPAQFAWMLRQSPYHNVVRGRAYPAVLMTTGENDPRVDPYNSRKMVARLQADSSSPYPVLLLQRTGEGHGIGNSFRQRIDDYADILTFFDSQLR